MMMHELPHAPTLEVEIGRPELMRHNRWNAGYFEERFRQNQIGMRERNTIRRNAIVAAGNSRSETLIDALTICARDGDPMVRQHALWAIWRIRGEAAGPALAKALEVETDPSVVHEINTLLDGIAGVA